MSIIGKEVKTLIRMKKIKEEIIKKQEILVEEFFKENIPVLIKTSLLSNKIENIYCLEEGCGYKFRVLFNDPTFQIEILKENGEIEYKNYMEIDSVYDYFDDYFYILLYSDENDSSDIIILDTNFDKEITNYFSKLLNEEFYDLED